MDNRQNSPVLYVLPILTLVAFIVINFFLVYQPLQNAIGGLNATLLRIEDDLQRLRAQEGSQVATSPSAPTPSGAETSQLPPEPAEVVDENIINEGIQPYQVFYTGNLSAQTVLSLTMFEDPQCSWCRVYNVDILPEVIDKYKDKVKFAIVHRMIDVIGGTSSRDIIAKLHCVGMKQGGDEFKRFVDQIYRNGDNLGDLYADEQAKAIEECVAKREWEAAYEQDKQVSQRLYINGTPTSYLAGQLIQGADKDRMVSIIEASIAK